MGAENLAPPEFRSPDRPASSESLYRVSATGHTRISLFFYVCVICVRLNPVVMRFDMSLLYQTSDVKHWWKDV